MTVIGVSNSRRLDRLVLINGKVVTPFRVIPRGGVAIEGGAIARVFSMDEINGVESVKMIGNAAENGKIIDVGGRVIAPGFIDIHVHGGGGADLMDGNPEAPLIIARAHARGGSTAIVPSTLTSSMEDLYQALDNMKYAKAKSAPGARDDEHVRDAEVKPGGIGERIGEAPEKAAHDGARILGIHLEGPYFSEEQRGAQDLRYLKKPDPEEYLQILAYSDDIIRVSVAPELDGALELGRELRRRGILASIGHTDATYDDVVRAIEAGYTHVTHLYSAMSGVRRINAYRVAGVIESALLLDELTVEIIADGKHLPGSLIKLIYKCKGPERIALVTDAMRAAGMPEGEYILGSLKDGQRVIVEDGVAKLPDRSAFAGSIATMDLAVRTVMNLGGVSLADAVKMATITPARIIGVDRTKGSLVAGKDADIVVFDEESVSVKMTLVEGRVVYNELV